MSNYSKTFRHNNSLRCKLVINTSLQITVMNSDDMSTKQLNISLPECFQNKKHHLKRRAKSMESSDIESETPSIQIVTTRFYSENSVEVILCDFTKQKVLKVHWVFMYSHQPVITVMDIDEEVA